VVAAAAVVPLPVAAAATGSQSAAIYTYSVGTPSAQGEPITPTAPPLPFALAKPLDPAISVQAGADPSVSLAFGILTQIGRRSAAYAGLGETPDPLGVQGLANGDVLVADGANHLVIELTTSGAKKWSYPTGNGSGPPLQYPTTAQRLPNGDTLICDEGARCVYEVTSHGDLVWQYGGASGAAEDVPGPDQLDDPVAAQLVSGQGATVGYVLICDAGAHDVVEVKGGDYAARAPNDGFTSRSTVWRYGTPGTSGAGVDELRAPRSAFESNGDVVICDAAADRVIAVRHSDYDAGKANDGYTQGSIDWHYGTPDTTNPGAFQNDVLKDPSDAWPGSSGYAWIADTGNDRVIAVDPSTGDQVTQFGPSGNTPTPSSLAAPVAVGDFSDGRLVIADTGADRIVTVGTTALTNGTNGHYGDNAETVTLDGGHPGMRKEFLTLSWVTSIPDQTTSVAMAISIDGGAAQTLQQTATATAVTVPAGTVGKTIAFVATLRTSDRMFTPILEGITVTYRKWTGKAAGGSGGGSSTKTHGGPGTTGQSGSGTSGGAGSGSGSGSGTGSGGGAGGRGTGSSAPGRAPAGAASPAHLPNASVATDAAADPVTGMLVGLVGEGGTLGVAGGQPSAQRVPALIAAALLVGALMLPAPLLVRRRLRRLAVFDHDATDRAPFE